MAARSPLGTGVRFQILQRDGFTCKFCGSRPGNDRLHVDHLLPWSKGGSNDEANLVTACDRCNVGKRDSIAVPLSMCDGLDNEDFHVWKRFGTTWYLSWHPDYWTMFICATVRRYWFEVDRVWEHDWTQHIGDKLWCTPEVYAGICEAFFFGRRIFRKPGLEPEVVEVEEVTEG